MAGEGGRRREEVVESKGLLGPCVKVLLLPRWSLEVNAIALDCSKGGQLVGQAGTGCHVT